MVIEIKRSFHRIPNGEHWEGDHIWTAHYHNPIRPNSWNKDDYFEGGDLHSPWAALAMVIEEIIKHFG